MSGSEKKRTTERMKKPRTHYGKYVGESTNGFILLEYKNYSFRAECVECGKKKWIQCKALLEGRIECDHNIIATYDESLIGQKFGHLTAIGKTGRFFVFRCDCGRERTLRATDVCRGCIVSCGDPNCEYHKYYGSSVGAIIARKEGFAFERRFADVFEKAGYKVIKTQDSGDFGVDVIVWIKGEKWAFQCKKHKNPVGSKAVAEVYAGGRYYDCTRFCVASPSGFTYQAKQMAAKLGVQLETKIFHFNVTLDRNAVELLPTVLTMFEKKRKLMWEIDGVKKTAEQWCDEYGVNRNTVIYRVKNGMDLKDALAAPHYTRREMIEINGVVKSKREWCDEYGISTQAYDYRIKKRGMSPFEALTEVKAR